MTLGIMVFLLALFLVLRAIKDQLEEIKRLMERDLEELRKGGERR